MLIVVGFRPQHTFTRHQKPYLFQTMLGENRPETVLFCVKKVMPIFGRSDTFSSMFQYVCHLQFITCQHYQWKNFQYSLDLGPYPCKKKLKKLNKYTFVTTTIHIIPVVSKILELHFEVVVVGHKSRLFDFPRKNGRQFSAMFHVLIYDSQILDAW